MSSGFVPAGTDQEPIERDAAWLQAQQQLEESRRQKERASLQEGGKSLAEVLQQNKAAKQEAFEESIRLKNQFRTLNDDEIDFLDSVLESTRTKELAIKKETAEQLDLFRKAQDEAEQTLLTKSSESAKAASPTNAGSGVTDDVDWAAGGKKRKRVGEASKTFKLRKSSSTTKAAADTQTPDKSAKSNALVKGDPLTDPKITPKSSSAVAGLGLDNYDSDDS